MAKVGRLLVENFPIQNASGEGDGLQMRENHMVDYWAVLV